MPPVFVTSSKVDADGHPLAETNGADGRVGSSFPDEGITSPDPPVPEGLKAVGLHHLLHPNVEAVTDPDRMPVELFQGGLLSLVVQGMVHCQTVLNHRAQVAAVQVVQLPPLEAFSAEVIQHPHLFPEPLIELTCAAAVGDLLKVKPTSFTSFVQQLLPSDPDTCDSITSVRGVQHQ